MTVDISLHPDFSAEDVSVAINDVVKNLAAGDSAYLDFGDYKIANTIYIKNNNQLMNNSVFLRGNYELVNHGLEVTVQIEGKHFEFQLQNITSNDKSDYYNLDENDTLPGGISLGETNSSKLDFGTIEGFEFGIRLYPNGDYTGINFNKISFEKISYCYTPILFSMPDELYCWINENQFYGGTLKGYYGIYYNKGKQQLDEYNNNTFYNIAFEAIEQHAVVADYCAYNTYIAPRFECVNKLTIKESETCRSNKYLNSVAIPFCSIQLKSRETIIDGPIHNNAWEVFLKGLHTDKYAGMHAEFFVRSIQEAYNTNKYLRDNVGIVNIKTDELPVELTLTKTAEFVDNEIRLYVKSFVNPITIIDEAGETIIPENIITTGVYLLEYFNDCWNVLKVSDSLSFSSK
ncbi:MAG: hypothetical protein RR177_05775 [Oscillospiraceae bacterium]